MFKRTQYLLGHVAGRNAKNFSAVLLSFPTTSSFATNSVFTNSFGFSTLPARSLPHRGVLVDFDGLANNKPIGVDEFAERLLSSCNTWKAEGRKCAWVKVPTAISHLIAPATAAGFEFHHAKPGFCVLKKWLPDSKDVVPPFATHQVATAGFVLNAKNELLVVKEWIDDDVGVGRHSSENWKMPGGMLDGAETFSEGCCRYYRPTYLTNTIIAPISLALYITGKCGKRQGCKRRFRHSCVSGIGTTSAPHSIDQIYTLCASCGL